MQRAIYDQTGTCGGGILLHIVSASGTCCAVGAGRMSAICSRACPTDAGAQIRMALDAEHGIHMAEKTVAKVDGASSAYV